MATQQDIEKHYDEDPAFFRLFLGPSMIYSCANWETADDLDSAQAAKVKKLLEFADVGPTTRTLLDIGCGWGGFLAATRRALGSAVALHGVTISPAQATFARTLLGHGAAADVEQGDFFATGDRIRARVECAVCVGAFEHFASPREHAAGTHVARYRHFFQRARARVDGPLALQTIVSLRDMADMSSFERSRYFRYLHFVSKSVFPNSLVPKLGDVEAAIAGTYRIDRCDVSSVNYARTLQAWRANLRSHAAREPPFSLFDRFFSLGIERFEAETLGVAQLRLAPLH